MRTRFERKRGEPVRPQSIIIKSLSDVPECRIDVDVDDNVTEYRWVKVDPESPDAK